jgi:hypothetical protein
MDLDTIDAGKNHEMKAVPENDGTNSRPTDLVFSGKLSENQNMVTGNSKEGVRRKPTLFSQAVKNSIRDMKENDGIIGNDSWDKGKTTDDNGWKIFSAKSNTSTSISN